MIFIMTVNDASEIKTSGSGADSSVVCTHEADFTIINSNISGILETLKELKDLMTKSAILQEQVDRLRQNQKDIDTRLRLMELDYARAMGTSKWMERILLIVVSIAVSGLLTGIMYKGGI